MGHTGARDIRRQLDRYFDGAFASLSEVWPAVNALADALLNTEELIYPAIVEVLKEFDLEGRVEAVQRERRLLESDARGEDDKRSS